MNPAFSFEFDAKSRANPRPLRFRNDRRASTARPINRRVLRQLQKNQHAWEESQPQRAQYTGSVARLDDVTTSGKADDKADDALLAAMQRGDEQAFRTLAHRHGPYLFGVARALVRDYAEAEDVVQETLAAALRGNFRGESSVRTWLVAIAVRQAANLRRKRTRWRAWTNFTGRSDGAASKSAEAAVDARLDLAGMLEHLSPEHREVIVLRELEGLSYEQIAQQLKLPRGTVESRLHHTREQLRSLFAADSEA